MADATTGSPGPAATGDAAAVPPFVVLLDAELTVRAAGGGPTGEAGVAAAVATARLRGRHLREVIGRADHELERAVVAAIVQSASVRHPLRLTVHGAPITAMVEIFGLLDQQGRRLAVLTAAARPGGPTGADGLDGLTLSERERQILDQTAQGLRVATIARTLGISPSTVRNHLSAIFRKVGVRNQAELLERLRPPPAG